MSGPFLIGRHVQLRPFEEEDASTLADWINDPEIRMNVLARFPKSIKNEKEWLASMSSGSGLPRDVVLGIERVKDRRLIGSIGLHQIDWVNRRAMTGMFLYSVAMRGKGYGTEAKNLLLDYAFGELGLYSVYALTNVGNEASIAALRKQGYTQSGVHRRAALLRGRRVDSLYFDLLLEEWEAMRGLRPAPARPAGKRPARAKARAKGRKG